MDYNFGNKKVNYKKLLIYAIPLVIFAGILHRLLDFYTGFGDRESSEFFKVLFELITPHSHFETISQIYSTSLNSSFLKFTTVSDIFLFWVPRDIYINKSSNYGTLIVQEWADLPNWFQIAITIPGELFAHNGFWALPLALFFGFYIRWLDSFLFSNNANNKFIFYGLILPRMLSVMSMGILAAVITLFQIIISKLIFKLTDIRITK
jgi:hypothetical protein